MDIKERHTDLTSIPSRRPLTPEEQIDSWLAITVIGGINAESGLSADLRRKLVDDVKKGYVLKSVYEIIGVFETDSAKTKEMSVQWITNLVIGMFCQALTEGDEVSSKEFLELCGLANSGKIMEALNKYFVYLHENS